MESELVRVLKKTQKDYSLAFKLEVVDVVEKDTRPIMASRAGEPSWFGCVNMVG